MKLPELSQPITQAEFAELLALSEARVSQLVTDGVIAKGQTGLDWLRAYTGRLREAAAGRGSMAPGGLDLAQERAALARAQRIAQEMKNAVAGKKLAPVSLLTEIHAVASQAVVNQLEALPRAIRMSNPDLPDAVLDQIVATIVRCRNEWGAIVAGAVGKYLDGKFGSSESELDEDESADGDGDGDGDVVFDDD